ncbi:MAG: hypothetical protein EB126_01690 [Synechococcaceae bacterium WBB_10_009]|nr:hypothetical protein [Synechococcaceae bacterium WBB_10_009]
MATTQATPRRRRGYSIRFRTERHTLTECCLYAHSHEEARHLAMELHPHLRRHPRRLRLVPPRSMATDPGKR